MAEKKKPDIPAPPKYQEDPRLAGGVEQLFGWGGKLTALDLAGPLAATIQTSPQMTTMFLQGLQAQLEPIFAEERRESLNRLAAQGQLAGSTLPSTLADIEKRKQQQYITQTSQFGMADIQRAMGARERLFGMGLGTLGQATGFAESAEARLNQFALQNYQNMLAKAYMEQEQQQGGWGGALSGAIGGGLGGFALGGPWGAAAGAIGGGIAGGYGPAGTGKGIMGGGFQLGAAKLLPLTSRTQFPAGGPINLQRQYENLGLQGQWNYNPFG